MSHPTWNDVTEGTFGMTVAMLTNPTTHRVRPWLAEGSAQRAVLAELDELCVRMHAVDMLAQGASPASVATALEHHGYEQLLADVPELAGLAVDVPMPANEGSGT